MALAFKTQITKELEKKRQPSPTVSVNVAKLPEVEGLVSGLILGEMTSKGSCQSPLCYFLVLIMDLICSIWIPLFSPQLRHQDEFQRYCLSEVEGMFLTAN